MFDNLTLVAFNLFERVNLPVFGSCCNTRFNHLYQIFVVLHRNILEMSKWEVEKRDLV